MWNFWHMTLSGTILPPLMIPRVHLERVKWTSPTWLTKKHLYFMCLTLRWGASVALHFCNWSHRRTTLVGILSIHFRQCLVTFLLVAAKHLFKACKTCMSFVMLSTKFPSSSQLGEWLICRQIWFIFLFREYFAHIDKSPLSVKNEIMAHFRQLWTISGEGSRILAVPRGLGFLFEISSEA